MNTVFRNILAVFTGVVIGSVVNMGIVMISGYVIPAPDGVDVTDMEDLAASIHLFEPKHFLMPFLAHALGTFVGAFSAAKIAASHNVKFGIGVGVFFLLGGIVNVFMLPSPTWFVVLDLSMAYIPMGILGGRLASKKK